MNILCFKIRLEYSERYRNEAGSNENGLSDKWSIYSTKLKDYYSEKVKERHYITRWPDDIEDFLLLLKLLPSKQAGRNIAATVENFNKASEMFITFELVDIIRISF